MKKFVKISGGYDNWFWLVETDDDLDEVFVDARVDTLQHEVQHDLYTDETKTTIRPDWLTRVQTTLTEKPNYRETLLKYGESLLIRKNGSYMTLGTHQIVAEYFGDNFPPDYIVGVDIVICENDTFPEPKWVVFLNENYPGKSIYTLNYFSERNMSLDGELNVPIISFSTTFTSYDWFERILDTIIRNGWTGKEIVGYSHDVSKWDFPERIASKVMHVIQLGNKLTNVNLLNAFQGQ